MKMERRIINCFFRNQSPYGSFFLKWRKVIFLQRQSNPAWQAIAFFLSPFFDKMLLLRMAAAEMVGKRKMWHFRRQLATYSSDRARNHIHFVSKNRACAPERFFSRTEGSASWSRASSTEAARRRAKEKAGWNRGGDEQKGNGWGGY